MNIGQKIMEGIINGKLAHAKCASDLDHACIITWSSGAAEQIEALAQPEKEASSVNCEDCGKPYSELGLDIILPEKQWSLISGRTDGGCILCASCITLRASKPAGLYGCQDGVGMKAPVEMISAFFATHRVLFNNEIELQDQIAEMFNAAGIRYEREMRIGRNNRLDFFLYATRSAIEIKKKSCGANDILRQLKRYADLPTIDEVILIAPQPLRNATLTLSGKPLHVVAIFASMV